MISISENGMAFEVDLLIRRPKVRSEGEIQNMPAREAGISMDPETSRAIFTRMYQALAMLRLIDDNRSNSSISVAELYQRFIQQRGENPNDFCFSNHQYFMGCLLAFVVLPHGTVDSVPERIVARLDRSWCLSNLTPEVGCDPNELTLQRLVRKLRNSISHARYWAKNGGALQFVFEDRPNDGAPVNFRAVFSASDLEGFCRRFNEWMITGC